MNTIHNSKESSPTLVCRNKFLHYFPHGFKDPKYVSWERGYKWNAHLKWQESLNEKKFHELLQNGQYLEIANAAIKIETKTNLLFSFEKMALRDAVKERKSAKLFAEALYGYIYGEGQMEVRFLIFSDVLNSLPKKQTRVRTWPLQTVFGFIADPKKHIFLKPTVTKIAAEKYGYPFEYRSEPNWDTYSSLLKFAGIIKKDNRDLHPADYMDIQSFIWVMGSGEYPD